MTLSRICVAIPSPSLNNLRPRFRLSPGALPGFVPLTKVTCPLPRSYLSSKVHQASGQKKPATERPELVYLAVLGGSKPFDKLVIGRPLDTLKSHGPQQPLSSLRWRLIVGDIPQLIRNVTQSFKVDNPLIRGCCLSLEARADGGDRPELEVRVIGADLVEVPFIFEQKDGAIPGVFDGFGVEEAA